MTEVKNKFIHAYYVYLNIDGFNGDGQVITDVLGFEPSEILLKGVLSPRGIPRPGSSWYYNSPINSVDAADHINHIIEKVINLKVLKNRVPTIDAFIQIVVNKKSEESMPILTFELDLMKKLIDNELSIDIDIV